jgi:hypothetical protein
VYSNLIWWFSSVYRVQGTTKEEFITTTVHVKMQRRHLYIVCHAARAAKVVVT